MTTLVGVGSSQKPIPHEAIEDAFHQASRPLEGHPPSFMLLLASATTYDQNQLLASLSAKAPESVLIGCSTSGEITPAGSMDNSVALMLIYSDTLKFVSGVGHNIADNPRDAGREMAKNIMNQAREIPKVALMLPDGLSGNGADIVRGVLDVFGQDFRLAGGSAGDDFMFKKTYQYHGKEVYSGRVVGVGIYGDFSFGIGVRHGWIPIGTPRIATKSKNNVLYELDGKSAITIYQDQFGKKDIVSKSEPFARLAITYPLGIVAPNQDGYLIRDPITVDTNGAITCAAEIPEGAEVYIMIGSRDEAIVAAQDAARLALAQVRGKTVKAAFLFNCIARKKLFMQKKQEEIDKIREILGVTVPIIGFYTYGEQAPLGVEIATCSFHNETDVLFVLAH